MSGIGIALPEEWNRRQPWLPPEDVETLRRVIRNTVATDSERAAVEAIIKKLTGGSPWNEAMDTTRTEGT